MVYPYMGMLVNNKSNNYMPPLMKNSRTDKSNL